MSEYALVKDNIVANIVVSDSREFINNLYAADYDIYESGGERGEAMIGSDMLDGKFRDPQPYPSWIWNTEAWEWEAPVPPPPGANPLFLLWDEGAQEWIIITPQD